MPKRSAGMPKYWMNTNGAAARYEKNAPNENMKTSAGPTNRRLRASGSILASALPMEPMRAWAGCDSSRNSEAVTMQHTAWAASSQRIQSHDAATSSQPPASGARIGAAPITSIMSESTCADWMASKRSRITARTTTMIDEPPKVLAEEGSAQHR